MNSGSFSSPMRKKRSAMSAIKLLHGMAKIGCTGGERKTAKGNMLARTSAGGRKTIKKKQNSEGKAL